MDVHTVALGEWTNSLMSRMINAADGDSFCLPTQMHLHAYMLLKEGSFADRDFKVELKDQEVA
jgi:hypothetical protein